MEAVERYKFSLADEVRKICVDELNEPANDGDIHDAIDELKKKFFERYPSLELISDDDIFLLRFLRSCKFDVAWSAKTLGCYHKLRNEWPEVFELVQDKVRLENALRKGAVTKLTGRAKDGSFVLLKRPGISGESVANFIASVFISYETIIQDEEAQFIEADIIEDLVNVVKLKKGDAIPLICRSVGVFTTSLNRRYQGPRVRGLASVYGFTIVADMSHLGFRFGMQLASFGRRFLRMLQEVLPIRIKKLNVVNEAFVFDAVFAIAGTFMKTSLKEKMKLHRSNVAGLQNSIDVTVLPPSLSGSGPEVDCEGWWTTIFNDNA